MASWPKGPSLTAVDVEGGVLGHAVPPAAPPDVSAESRAAQIPITALGR